MAVSSFNPHAPRGARLRSFVCFNPRARVSIRTPREGRDSIEGVFGGVRFVSIRTPREGRDQAMRQTTSQKKPFQSARPARGATLVKMSFNNPVEVSIRTPREGRDDYCCHDWDALRCFNPHAPRGARPETDSAVAGPSVFQSARPARGATGERYLFAAGWCSFNPHAPRGARLHQSNYL